MARTGPSTTTGNSDIIGDNIVTIAVDDDNAIWAASWVGGLSRFDGTSWTNWDDSNAPFYPDYQCITSIEFYDDKVWVGVECDMGLQCYDPMTDSWTTIAGLPHGYITAR
jgi:ligand-binding sensor domain-containing protein